ncbi:hypothetical protein QF031_000960 [Pseudarthrobacter defluvii]|uniref:competence protein CoiA family protein n=1 Tax=Pseudarthrobacter defluvii TaxID=410837 RepID=UPI0027802E81|nr:competence protein CoiA family protein [Pseudarthrobacter defluvii]MDQ0768211.1 hypothetical protein [Pseudarthrobacter defluvii]
MNTPHGATHVLYAVARDPYSMGIVIAPRTQADALPLKRLPFFCSRLAGGCGATLTLAAGPVRIPHFRHLPKSACALRDADRARDNYTHVAIQLALLKWINAVPGFGCTMEERVEGGRTDLYVAGPGTRVSLEVQRSDISPFDVNRRTALYSRKATAVNWLYEVDTIQACRQELKDAGLCLRVSIDAELTECSLGVTYSTGEGGKTTTIWSPLSEWWINAGGLGSPHLALARKAVTDWRREAAATAEVRRVAAALAKEKKLAQQKLAAEYRRLHRQWETGQRARGQTLKEWATQEVRIIDAKTRHANSRQGYGRDVWSPSMQGSQEDVAWARNIRDKVRSIVERNYDAGFLSAEYGAGLTYWLAAKTEAGWWIGAQLGEHEAYTAVIKMYDLILDTSGRSGARLVQPEHSFDARHHPV